MPPTVLPSHLLSPPHRALHQSPSRERRELNSSTSSVFLYSTTVGGAGAKDAAMSARDLKRHRSSTLEDSPPPTDSKAATGRIASRIPTSPMKKPSLLHKKPAAAPLYIKTSTSRNPSAAPRPPSAVPTTPTNTTSPNLIKSNTSFPTLASPVSPPLKRRQPARFSSNGISTSAGPPPSLAYRKTNGVEQQRTYNPQTPKTSRVTTLSTTPITIRGGGAIQHSDKMEVDEDEKDQDRTIRGLEDIPRQPIDSKTKYKREEQDDDIAMTDYDSNKELFLSLAKAEPPRVGINATKRTQERQQARAAQHSSIPTLSRPVSISDASDVSPLTTYPNNRKTVPVPVVDALAEAMEAGPRDLGERHIERIASPGRAPSSHKFGTLLTPKTLNPSPIQQGRTIATMLEQDKANQANDASGSVAGDTASTVSTNAASVWDELEELKSRIHKLEVNGNYSKGSDSSGGRPRTATTTATTLSSSPRNNNISGQSPSSSMLGNPLHPLLQQALSRAKQYLDAEVYKALEATAKDAFALVDIVGSSNTSGTMAGTPSQNGILDRQVRRKIDSLCRGLTELSIALSEASKHATSQIPAAPPSAAQTPSSSFTSVDSYTTQRSHLSSLGRQMARESGLEPRRDLLEERATTGLGLRSGRESVLSDRKLLNRRLEAVETPRRPSMQNLSTPSALQGLQQSASYSDIARRSIPGSAAGMDAALKLERAKAQRAEALGRSTPAESMTRDGQIDHIMHDLEVQESVFRTPLRATTARRRAEERSALEREREREREREIDQLTQDLGTSRRPALYHNRSSSSATVTQSSVVTQRNLPMTMSQPTISSTSRMAPLSPRRSLDREREDGVPTTPMDRVVRRSFLSRSMQEPASTPLSPVEASRRFFDEKERERERAQRNTIHGEGGYASVTAGRREGGSISMELKRKSHCGSVPGTPGRGLRSAAGVGYEEAGVTAEREREKLGTREGEGRRFLRRRME